MSFRDKQQGVTNRFFLSQHFFTWKRKQSVPIFQTTVAKLPTVLYFFSYPYQLISRAMHARLGELVPFSH